MPSASTTASVLETSTPTARPQSSTYCASGGQLAKLTAAAVSDARSCCRSSCYASDFHAACSGLHSCTRPAVQTTHQARVASGSSSSPARASASSVGAHSANARRHREVDAPKRILFRFWLLRGECAGAPRSGAPADAKGRAGASGVGTVGGYRAPWVARAAPILPWEEAAVVGARPHTSLGRSSFWRYHARSGNQHHRLLSSPTSCHFCLARDQQMT